MKRRGLLKGFLASPLALLGAKPVDNPLAEQHNDPRDFDSEIVRPGGQRGIVRARWNVNSVTATLEML